MLTATEIKTRVSRNLNQLAGDESTIVGAQITETALDEILNDTYRQVCNVLSDEFPEKFTVKSVPIPLYIVSGTVSSGSGYTLTAGSEIFETGMVGATIENPTAEETAVIVEYTSATEVVLDTEIGTDWDSDTIYVLDNEFGLGGSDFEDAKEIVAVEVNYDGSDPDEYEEALYTTEKELRRAGNPGTENNPYWYHVNLEVNDIFTDGVGLMPKPDSYLGRMIIHYIKLPPALTDDSEPVNFAGIDIALINGVTASALHSLKMHDDAKYYEELAVYTQEVVPRGVNAIIHRYKPRTRGKVKRMKPSSYIRSFKKRSF